ncbi:hypothetical protein PRZ48_000295 [Zasmidium cellare]|uniref:Uncharacterized protein n=1 Tax=Zasmidium cellare TaxID=395010 RepID=A0ABR0EZP2_ZASCE|nr:hypothetical protein PRZ48_000295 [Zasmidium cellare]
MNIDEQASKFAIHAACREGQTQKVISLLNADPKLALRPDDDERLPQHWAAAHNHLEILTILSETKKFDVDAQDGAGWTALMMASSLKDGDELVDFLLDQKSADPGIKTNGGQTALHFAASKGNLETARKLLSKGATARVKDKRGQLPLHRAAAVGNVPILKVLLDAKSAVNATDGDGSTALHHAVAEGHGDAAVELLRRGAEWGKEDGGGKRAIELAPDGKVRGFVLRGAVEEGVDVGGD